MTSGGWVSSITEKCGMLVLFRLDVELVWKDGSLNWSRVKGMSREGVLCGPGCVGPFGADALAERRRLNNMARASAGLRVRDPFAPPRAVGGRGRSRGVGRGKQRANRGRGSAQGSRHEPMVEHVGALQDVFCAPGINEDWAEDGPPPESQVTAETPGEFDMRDFETELAELMEEDLVELIDTYAGDGGPETQYDDADGLLAESAVEPTIAASFEKKVAEEYDETGMMGGPDHDDDAPGEVRQTALTSASSSSEAPPAPSSEIPAESIAAPTGETVGDLVGPSPAGFVSMHGRTVMRILRGNPRNSLSVRCYRHVGCSFLLSLRDAPADEDLLRWLIEVPAPADGATSADKKELARRHVALADRWRSRRKAVTAKAGAGQVV